MDRALFKDIADAAANAKSDNIRDGKGRLIVVQNIYRVLNDGRTWITRFRVLSSEAKGDLDPITKQPVAPNAPGSRVGWVQKVDRYKSAKGNVKAFVLALLGYKEAEVTGEQFQDVCVQMTDTTAATRGMVIDFETYQQKTKTGVNAGQINTYVRFIHVPPTAGNSKEEIAKRRAELDQTDPLEP